MEMQILHRDDVPLGGFAGLKEHRLVRDSRVGGDRDAWQGIGNFVYLADARFMPKGETGLHPHKVIDVISVMVEGNISHKGSLEHGGALHANQVQVQRSGSEGFSHNEINPDDAENRMIQLWVLPEKTGGPAGYKLYDLEKGGVTRIYGGPAGQDATFDSHTVLEVGWLENGQEVAKEGPFLVYLTKGSGIVNGKQVRDGDLVQGEGIDFRAGSDGAQVIVVTIESD